MVRTTAWVILVTAGMLAGCGHSEQTKESAAGTSGAVPPVAASSNPQPSSASDTGTAVEGNALIEANDRAIEENKRQIAMLGRYQAEDFQKYERLRKTCEVQEHGTLADSAAPAVARCIQAGW